jgi:hypothetical protein
MDKSIESSSNQTGDKGLDANDKSIESPSNQTGAKGLDAVDPSIGSSSSQEGIRSLEDKEAEAWRANTKAMFDERTNGTKKWGDNLSDDGDQDTSDKGSKVTKDNKGHDSDGFTTDENDEDPKKVNDNSGTAPPLTKTPEEERVFTFEFIKDSNKSLIKETVGQEAIKSPNKTQVQESSSAAAPLVNRSEGTTEDEEKWIDFLSSPRRSKPNTPNREVSSRSPGYEPPPLKGSDISVEDVETQDQDMIEEPADPYTQEEAEEHFIQALVERSQNGELNTIEEVIQAILDIGGEAIRDEGLPITFTARIALKLLQRSLGPSQFTDQKL